jgi:hypothetical protein
MGQSAQQEGDGRQCNGQSGKRNGLRAILSADGRKAAQKNVER